jgi:hypothetical protein
MLTTADIATGLCCASLTRMVLALGGRDSSWCRDFASLAGDWLCTVRYHDKREASGGRLCRSNCGRFIFDSSQL